MALLKDLIVTGASKFIGDAYFNVIKTGTWNGSTITTSYGGTGLDGTVKNTSSSTKNTTTTGGLYLIELDKDGKLAVRVPWTNVNSSYKTTQTAVTDPSADGTSLTFIATISLTTNGNISVTKKTVSDYSGATTSADGTHGLVPAATKDLTAYVLAGTGWTNSLSINTSGLAGSVANSLSFSKDGGYTNTSSYNGSSATTISYDTIMPTAAVTFIKNNLYTPAVSNNKPANNNALSLSEGAYLTTFTVTCKDASGTLMDMASGFPKYNNTTSFTKSSTGTYTYTLSETIATLKSSTALGSSKSITCSYGGVTKTISSTRYIKKPSFIFYSATDYLTDSSSMTDAVRKTLVDNLLSGTATTGVTVANTLNNYSITGDRSVTITNGQYCFFAVPVYTDATKLSTVKLLGSIWLKNTNSTPDYKSITTTSWGTYKLFRSLNTGNGSAQNITIS